jgi:hypothetical protein
VSIGSLFKAVLVSPKIKEAAVADASALLATPVAAPGSALPAFKGSKIIIELPNEVIGEDSDFRSQWAQSSPKRRRRAAVELGRSRHLHRLPHALEPGSSHVLMKFKVCLSCPPHPSELVLTWYAALVERA